MIKLSCCYCIVLMPFDALLAILLPHFTLWFPFVCVLCVCYVGKVLERLN